MPKNAFLLQIAPSGWSVSRSPQGFCSKNFLQMPEVGYLVFDADLIRLVQMKGPRSELQEAPKAVDNPIGPKVLPMSPVSVTYVSGMDRGTLVAEGDPPRLSTFSDPRISLRSGHCRVVGGLPKEPADRGLIGDCPLRVSATLALDSRRMIGRSPLVTISSSPTSVCRRALQRRYPKLGARCRNLARRDRGSGIPIIV